MFKFIKNYCNKRIRIKLYPVMIQLSLEIEESKKELTSFYYYKKLLNTLYDKFQCLYRLNVHDYPKLNKIDYKLEQAIFFCGLVTCVMDRHTDDYFWDEIMQNKEHRDKLLNYMTHSKNLTLDAIKELTNIMQDMIGYEPEKENS